jgi:hypothetical protein
MLFDPRSLLSDPRYSDAVEQLAETKRDGRVPVADKTGHSI